MHLTSVIHSSMGLYLFGISSIYAYNTLYTSYRPSTFFSVHIAMFANHLMSQASKALNDMNETTLGGHHSILDKPKDVGVSLQQKQIEKTGVNMTSFQHQVYKYLVSCFTQKQQQKSRANSNAKLSYMKAENVDLNFLSLCWLRDLRFEINLVCHIAVDTQISYKLR